ncbi:MAG: pyruvate phosphate dikinase PEP/pyruvate-binding protein [Leptolyngbya foveolarum]|uniref:Pyruvate phosphate dikinase PEP/pyruvate-binding protein n=1 Tax=Leptolyngbya foveolarum TaxID=47253 RepID=A0A2W4TSH7_9CYAN|nr:MAG: pyruvate phosphate dikinase PEP/pyruvate-binding protein [Leptolyngbya foveolarum]
MDQVFGALLIFTLVPGLGALPLSGWIVRLFSGQQLSQVGTGNVGVSAAFYHGGTVAGIFAVVAEALKGIAAVLIARYFFGSDAIWPVFSLIFLVMGRYWGSQGAGTTNVAWGFFVYDPLVAGLVFLVSFIGFTVLRMREQGRLFVLVLMPLLTALIHPTDGGRVLAVACLSGLVFWIYQKIPDDLELPAMKSTGESRRMFRFFQGDRALKSLATVLDPSEVGAKAATLSQLEAWGYPVAPGYVLPAGDDPTALIRVVSPSATSPVVVRSSAVGEDSLTSSAAGQYVSVTEVNSPAALDQAITVCLNAYNSTSARSYRESRDLPDGKMTVLVQPHIFGTFSGVAFSRDPVAHMGDQVVVEALPGDASRVVSGQVTPERYQVSVDDAIAPNTNDKNSWQLPQDLALNVQGSGKTPKALIAQVAYLTRHLERSFHGIPQDVEWTFDGEQLWVLQSRPVTTLVPIWTRKIAAEVIPGVIRPLTWSINRPLTCGVWGRLFTSVLGDRADGLDFTQTATLHYSRAYFNATLLGDLFSRMGLPPDSLEFLTRGAKFNRPPLATTARNLPGLWRLLRQEMKLPKKFAAAQRTEFSPIQAQWEAQPLADLDEPEIIERIKAVMSTLEEATYYNILAPLSLALRQALFGVDLALLDNGKSPEVMALVELKEMADGMRSLIPELDLDDSTYRNTSPGSGASLFAALSEHPDGHPVFDQLEQFLNKYGYLSATATDIAVPTWRESPQPVKELLTQFLLQPPTSTTTPANKPANKPNSPSNTRFPLAKLRQRQVQARLDLKGQVAEVYNRLLATLRSCFVELESRWLTQGHLQKQGDIFFLTWPEIQDQVAQTSAAPVDTTALEKAANHLKLKVELAAGHWQAAGNHRAPYLVYGQPTAVPTAPSPMLASETLKGIGASAGRIEGTIQVLENLSDTSMTIDRQTILVVPYTDAGWSPLLARIGGLISEVGGQLSHGAIVAREYGIPAVMDVTDATHRLATGQRVRIDGQQGTIEVIDEVIDPA